MKTKSMETEPQIGYWWTFCCRLDLAEIKDETDILEIQTTREYHRTKVWATKEEALKDLEGNSCDE